MVDITRLASRTVVLLVVILPIVNCHNSMTFIVSPAKCVLTTGKGEKAFSVDSSLLACAEKDGSIFIFNSTGENRVSLLKGGHVGTVSTIVFSSDKELLASSSFEDGNIVLWRINTAKEIRRLKMPPGPIYKMAFTPNDTLLVSSFDALRIWNYNSNMVETKVGDYGVVLATSKRGRLIAIERIEKKKSKIEILHGQSLNLVGEVDLGKLPENEEYINSIDISDDEKFLACGSSKGKILIYKLMYSRDRDKAKAVKCREFVGHMGMVESLRFLAGGAMLMSLGGPASLSGHAYFKMKGDEYYGLKIWNLNDGSLLLWIKSIITHAKYSSEKSEIAYYDEAIRSIGILKINLP